MELTVFCQEIAIWMVKQNLERFWIQGLSREEVGLKSHRDMSIQKALKDALAGNVLVKNKNYAARLSGSQRSASSTASG